MEKVKAAAGAIASMTMGDMPPLPPSASSPAWTSPGRPASPLPPAPPSSPSSTSATSPAPTTSGSETTSQTATAILDELVVTIDGVRAAILASVDGFGVASSSSMPHEASHPAMLAAAVGLAHQLVQMAGGADLRQLVVDHDGGLMVVWPIGGQRVLAVLADGTFDQRALRSFVRMRTELLAGAAS